MVPALDAPLVVDPLAMTIGGADLKLYLDGVLDILHEERGESPKRREEDVPLAEHYKDVLFLLDGLRGDDVFQRWIETRGDDVDEDESLLQVLTHKHTNVPYSVDRLVVENVFRWSAEHLNDPFIFRRVPRRADLHMEELKKEEAIGGSPRLLLELTEVYSSKLNTVLHMGPRSAAKGSSLQSGRYNVDNSMLADEIFTSSLISVAPRAFTLYKSRIFLGESNAYVMDIIPTHSQARIDKTVEELNTFFDHDLDFVVEKVVEGDDDKPIYVGMLNGERLGRYVSVLEPQKAINRRRSLKDVWKDVRKHGFKGLWRKRTMTDLETLLQPVRGEHYAEIDANLDVSSVRDLPNVAFLCEDDYHIEVGRGDTIRQERVFRDGQFYEAPQVHDHFFYKSRKLVEILLSPIVYFATKGDRKEAQRLKEQSNADQRKANATLVARLAGEIDARYAAEADALRARTTDLEATVEVRTGELREALATLEEVTRDNEALTAESVVAIVTGLAAHELHQPTQGLQAQLKLLKRDLAATLKHYHLVGQLDTVEEYTGPIEPEQLTFTMVTGDPTYTAPVVFDERAFFYDLKRRATERRDESIDVSALTRAFSSSGKASEYLALLSDETKDRYRIRGKGDIQRMHKRLVRSGVTDEEDITRLFGIYDKHGKDMYELFVSHSTIDAQVERAEASVGRFGEVVQILLGLADIKGKYGAYDLSEHVAQVVDTAGGLMSKSDIVVESYDGIPLMTEASSISIYSCLLTTIGNAGKFGRKKNNREVRIHLDEVEDDGIRYARISVTDKGPGVPDEVMPEIYEKGFTTEGSTGLGLYFGKRLMEREEGKLVLLENKTEGEETGATFAMYIPLAV
jgi:signal transduction histidine kinase